MLYSNDDFNGYHLQHYGVVGMRWRKHLRSNKPDMGRFGGPGKPRMPGDKSPTSAQPHHPSTGHVDPNSSYKSKVMGQDIRQHNTTNRMGGSTKPMLPGDKSPTSIQPHHPSTGHVDPNSSYKSKVMGGGESRHPDVALLRRVDAGRRRAQAMEADKRKRVRSARSKIEGRADPLNLSMLLDGGKTKISNGGGPTNINPANSAGVYNRSQSRRNRRKRPTFRK